MSRVEHLADGVTLFLGDSRDVLPLVGHVDHIICDPPYEDELHTAVKDQRIRRIDGKPTYEDLGFAGINADRAELARLMVAASSGWLVVFCLAEGVRAWRR